MKLATIAAVIAAPLFTSFCGAAGEPEPRAVERAAVTRMLPELHLLAPIWDSTVIYGESVLPMQLTADGEISGRLGWVASELLEVRSADGKRKLEIGREARLSADGGEVIFTPESASQFVKGSELFPPATSGVGYAHRVGHAEQNLLYGPGSWFHDRQFEVTYRRRPAPWPSAVPSLQEAALAKTLARLRAKQPLTIGVSGDSISAGYNASGVVAAAPGQAAYPDLVAAQLEATYGGEVKLVNRAIAGWSIANGIDDLPKILAEKPQLILVAYGMNDVGRRDPAWFKERTQTLVEQVRQADPDIELILVAPMIGHGEWIHTPRAMFPLYRDALASLTGDGVALADVTAIWETLLQHKHDLDLTGNGLNHPNDFGHRLYAQAILALLAPRGG